MRGRDGRRVMESAWAAAAWAALAACAGAVMGAAATQGAAEGGGAPARLVSGALHVGWAGADITPDRPVAVVGQLYKRIARKVRDPLTATALALETRSAEGPVEQAIMVSCDVIMIQRAIQQRVRELVRRELPDFDVRKLFLNATHTHTAPGFFESTFKGLYDVSRDEGVMTADEYGEIFARKVAGAAVEAWRKRRPGAMSWALGHAVIGHNRRAVYFNGSAAMYGSTAREDFANIEGGEDHGVEMLFFWAEGKLTGMVVNIACTAQETENLSEISADFWHEARLELRRRWGEELFVLAQCGAAGDQSPHLLWRKQAEQAMDRRRGLTRRQEIARRIAGAVEDVMPVAREGMAEELVFMHDVATVKIPEKQPPAPPFYETDDPAEAELHVIRLGDVAIATNPFELYLDYGLRMKGRSRAVLTMVVQLCSGQMGYLPTEKGVRGGGYSADKYVVGPEGGQVLVEETVKRINRMWPAGGR